MGGKAKISHELKLRAVKTYLNGKDSINHIAKQLSVDFFSVKQWIFNYQSLGEEGLITTGKNFTYSTDLKMTAVKDYLSGTGSQLDICKKYGIRSKTQLCDWIKKYNSHEKIKSSGAGGSQIMDKGRNTTFEERVEIVKYCIEHNRNYNETAEKYLVSYQQVRNWIVKYEESGVDALTDRRGKQKPEEQLTGFDRLKAQNKLLGAQNRRLEMENELLKKVQEIERG